MASPYGRALSTDQIVTDLQASRDRLTSSLEVLVDRVHPNRVKQRLLQRVREQVAYAKDRARAQVIDEKGDVRTSRLAIAGGAGAGVLAFWLLVRRLLNRRSS